MKKIAILLAAIIMLAIACAPKSAVRQPPQGFYIEPPGTGGRLQAQASVDKNALQKYGLLNFDARLANVSNQILNEAELVYVFYDEDGNVAGRGSSTVYDLKPGRTTLINWQADDRGLVKKIVKYELTLKNAKWGADPTLYSPDDFPRNPLSPGEVIVAYYCFTARIDYENTKNLVSAAIRDNQFPEKSVWEADTFELFGSEFKSAMIMEEYIYETYARVKLMMYYKDGSAWPSTMTLVLENGEWKITRSTAVDAGAN